MIKTKIFVLANVCWGAPLFMVVLKNFKGQQLHFCWFSDKSFYIILNRNENCTRITTKIKGYRSAIAPISPSQSKDWFSFILLGRPEKISLNSFAGLLYKSYQHATIWGEMCPIFSFCRKHCWPVLTGWKYFQLNSRNRS